MLSQLLKWLVILAQACSARDFQFFKTEPTFKASNVVVYVTSPPSILADGKIFIAPFDGSKMEGYGPQIFDQDGTLIWYGNATADNRIMDFGVCDYLGSQASYLCFHDAIPEFSAYARGNVRFLDNSYNPVGPRYGAAGGLQAPDLHELNMADNGNLLLLTVYDIKKADLSPYNGPKRGYVLDGCFQERDITDGRVTFQWCATDHVQLWETEVYIHQSSNYSTPIAGNGTLAQPWDFFHINSIDKDEAGDYLISARHMDAVLKVAGKTSAEGRPGSIIWQLGGQNSTFTMPDDLRFSRQHMARFLPSSDPEYTELTLFDNAFDGHLSSYEYSRGMHITLSHANRTANLTAEYPSPEGWLSHSQGGMQVMSDNGNVFMTWGFYPSFSEFAANGSLLYHASFGVWGMDMESYRAYKAPWRGFPSTKPKVLGYSARCGAPVFAYASWNGATEVAGWRVYASRTTEGGPWSVAGEFSKAGFETTMELGWAFAPYVYLEALDEAGTILGTSEVARTFVPADDLVGRCNARECFEPEGFGYEEAWSQGALCEERSVRRPALALLIWLAALSAVTLVAMRWMRRRSSWLVEGVITPRE